MDKEFLDMVTKEQLDRSEIDKIRMLIQGGANLIDTDPADWTTLLYHACRNGHLEGFFLFCGLMNHYSVLY
jgi:hypothetical protein